MTLVITSLCRDCLDISCVEVCPVDCIVEYKGEGGDWPPSGAIFFGRGTAWSWLERHPRTHRVDG